MPRKHKIQREAQGIVHLRLGEKTRLELAELSDSTRRTATDLAASAIEEFLEVVKYARDIEAGVSKEYDIDDFVPCLGHRWVQRLLILGIGGEAMKLSWRRHNEASISLREEIDADKAESKKKKETP